MTQLLRDLREMTEEERRLTFRYGVALAEFDAALKKVMRLEQEYREGAAGRHAEPRVAKASPDKA